MAWRDTRIGRAAQGTAIALLTWLVLYLTKEHLGRNAALVVACLIFLFVIFVIWARFRRR
jgi:hypothetical protein